MGKPRVARSGEGEAVAGLQVTPGGLEVVAGGRRHGGGTTGATGTGVRGADGAETTVASVGRRPRSATGGRPVPVPLPLPRRDASGSGARAGATGTEASAGARATALHRLVTGATPFREVGDVPVAVWEREGARVGSPITRLDLAACAASATGFGALALAQAIRETGLGRQAPPGSRNALGLMGADGRTPLRFGSWAEGFAQYRHRLADLGYRGGVYAPVDLPLAGFVATYVGGPGCRDSGLARCANGETRASVGRYLADVVRMVNGFQASGAGSPVSGVEAGVSGPGGSEPDPPRSPVHAEALEPSPRDRRPDDGHLAPETRHPRPVVIDRIIPPGVNTAWDDLGERTIRGVCLHRMLGTLDGTDAWFRGPARMTSRTDFGIGDGRIYQWTPLTGRMAPWASGPANDLEGDGVAFVRRYGIAAVNRDLVSIEIAGQYETGVPPADWACLVDLVAWIAAAWLRVDAATWPRNREGMPALYGHWEFGPKPCPGEAVRSRLGELVEDVRARLSGF